MKKFLKNSFMDVSIKGDAHIIDIFSVISGEKKIIVTEKSHLVYLIIAKNASLDVQIDIQWQYAFCQIFTVFCSDKDVLDAKIVTHIGASSTKVEKYVLSLLGEWGKISIDANIDIKKWIQDVTAHLLEENIVFGAHMSVKSLPALSVASHDVQASHGAKVEKISQDRLFYMQSKWLDQDDAQKLVVDGYVNAILSHFDVFDDKELSTVRNFIQL